MKNDRMFTMQLTQLFNEVINELPLDDVKNIREFIEHNEFGLAYEILCTQLYEYEIRISSDYYEKISSYGVAIKISPSNWLPLKELIIEK